MARNEDHLRTQTELNDLQTAREDAVTEAELTNLATIEPIPPNGGYGWVCALSVFLINSHTWGINSAWAVIMAHFLLHPDYIKASHLEFALVGGCSISQALLISPLVNNLSKRIGMRWTLLMGTILVFVSLMTASFATKIWHLFLSQGCCFGWGMGLIYITASAALPSWFSTRRSLAVGIATSGAGIGGLVYSLAANAAIQNLGVAWAYRILAFSSLAANMLASGLMKESGGRTQSSLDELRFNPRDFGRIEVVLIMFWGVATEFGYITLMYSIPSYASTIGLTATQGSIANALLNLGLGLGRPLIGHFSDVLGRINMALAMTALCTLLCFAMWIPAQSFAPLAAFSFLAGALCGTFWSTITPVLVEIVGLRKLASTFGIICLAMVLPTTFAESAAIQLVHKVDDIDTSSFLKAQIFVGCMFLAGTLSLWMLRCWKIFNTESERLGAEVPSTRRSKYSVSWLTPRLLFGFWHV
ncbi:Fc.00g025900.m01.CDS01 [Cosmosporella sp. VM-42]